MTDQRSTPSHVLTPDQVHHVAKLARLSLSDEQVERFAQQLSMVLEHVSKLEQLDVSSVEPASGVAALTHAMREDEPVAGLPVEMVLANAPDSLPPFFRVPKVLSEGPGA